MWARAGTSGVRSERGGKSARWPWLVAVLRSARAAPETFAKGYARGIAPLLLQVAPLFVSRDLRPDSSEHVAP